MTELEQFTELCKVIDTLLGENGCPWDRAQTHETLRPHLLEESYEVADAIDNNDMKALREELGDLLLHVIIHSRIAAKNSDFTLSQVIGDVAHKLVSRHTHIFADDTANSIKEVEDTWEANKKKEKAIFTPLQNMEAVPNALPALARAQKVIKRSESELYTEDTTKKLHSLLDTLCTLENEPDNRQGLEISGDILLFLSALLTKLQINAEFSLTKATLKFINSFR